jgi:hypothetical protein
MPLYGSSSGIRDKQNWVELLLCPELVFVDLLRSPRIDSQPGGPVRQPCLSYRPDRLHRLAKSIPRTRFPSSINVYKYGLCARFCKRLRIPGIDSKESILRNRFQGIDSACLCSLADRYVKEDCRPTRLGIDSWAP